MTLVSILTATIFGATALAGLAARLTHRRILPAVAWTYGITFLIGVAVQLSEVAGAGRGDADVLNRGVEQILHVLTVAGAYGWWTWCRRRRTARRLAWFEATELDLTPQRPALYLAVSEVGRAAFAAQRGPEWSQDNARANSDNLTAHPTREALAGAELELAEWVPDAAAASV